MKVKGKNILKKACAVTLTATMLMGSGLTEIGKYIGTSISAAAAYNVKSGSCGAEGYNVTYTLNSEGTITISGAGEMRDYDDSPNEHSPFYENQNIKKVIIKDGVTSIGDYAFNHCTSLIDIKIPDSVTSIGEGAFLGCTSLKEATIPNNVTSIGDWAFAGCDGLIGVTIPNSIISIGDGVFLGCTSIKEVTIPNSVTKIGNRAFDYCSSLTNIKIPNSVTKIGNWAFYYCTSLKKIEIPNSLASIGYSAFSDCTNLKDVYYAGSKEEWEKINIGNDNEYLTNATIHYNYTMQKFEIGVGAWTTTLKLGETSMLTGTYTTDGNAEEELKNTKWTSNDTNVSASTSGNTNASSLYEDFDMDGATYSIIGDFNSWSGDVALTDEDGDGLYTTTISVPTEGSDYKVRANGVWDYNWGALNKDGFTANSQDNCHFTEDQYGKEVTVYFDTRTGKSGIDTWYVGTDKPNVPSSNNIGALTIGEFEYIVSDDKKSASLYLDVTPQKYGSVDIKGVAGNGAVCTSKIYIEPEMTLTSSPADSSGKKNSFYLKINMKGYDKNYLKKFIDSLRVSGTGIATSDPYIVYSADNNGSTADIYYYVQNAGDVDCTVITPGNRELSAKMTVDADGYYSRYKPKKSGIFSSGVLSNVDENNKTIVVDGKTYDVSNEAAVSASSILKDKKYTDKTVILCSNNDVVTSIDSIYYVLRFNVFLEPKDEPFIYNNGKFNKTSSDVKVTVKCVTESTYPIEKLQALDLSLNISKIKAESYNKNVYFKNGNFLNKQQLTDNLKKTENIKLGKSKEFTYVVNVKDDYVPNEVQNSANINFDFTVDGSKYVINGSNNFYIGNFDLQKKDNLAHKKQCKTLKEKLDKTQVASISGLGDIFSAEDVQTIQQFLTAYVAEVMCTPKIEKSSFFDKVASSCKSKLKSAMYKQFGIEEKLLPNTDTIEVNLTVAGYSKENKIVKIDFNIGINTYSISTGTYGSVCYVNYKVKNKNNIPKNAQQTGSGVITTYNMKAFANAILDYVKYSYMECWGKNANTVAAMFEAKPLDAMFNGNYSGHFFDLTKKLVKYSASDNMEEELAKDESKTIFSNSVNWFKKSKVECPVDVYVYDSEGNLAAAIVNNEVDIRYNGVYCNVIGDTKEVYMMDDDYTIKLIGNDEGLMKYTIEEYNDGKLVRSVSEENIPLKGGKEYESFIPDIPYIDGDVYSLVSDKNDVIKLSNDSIVAKTLLGDTNGDGEVDIADALMISRYDAGLITLDEAQLSVSDVNKDGEVDIADALMLSRYDAGLIDSIE